MLFVLKYSARALALASIASFVVARTCVGRRRAGKYRSRRLPDRTRDPRAGRTGPGLNVPVILRATNSSSRPIRVVGIGEACTRWVCVRRATGLPCVVPPHATVEFGFRVVTKDGNRVGDAGFDREVALYSDCPGKNITAIHVSGKIRRDDAEK